MSNEKYFSGEITVFIALIMSVLGMFVCQAAYNVKMHIMDFNSECVTEIALHSIFAEYNIDLFEQYDLLLIDSSYGREEGSIDNVAEHFEQYILVNLSKNDNTIFNMDLDEASFSDVLYASDNGGKPVLDQIIHYMEEYHDNGRNSEYSLNTEDDGDLLDEYLMEKLNCYVETVNTSNTHSEIEYIIYGYDNDNENVDSMLSDIIAERIEENQDFYIFEEEEGYSLYEISEYEANNIMNGGSLIDGTDYKEILFKRLKDVDISLKLGRFMHIVEENIRERDNPYFSFDQCIAYTSATAYFSGGLNYSSSVSRQYGYEKNY